MLNIKINSAYLAMAGVLLVAGCQSGGGGSVGNQVAGGLVQNQVSGGANQVSSVLISALANNVIGGSIGQTLDATSKNAALTAEYNALESGTVGQPIPWQGQNGSRGQVVPQQAYQVGSQNCRRYIHTIFIDGQPQEASGTACSNPDGVWQPLT